MKTIAMQINTDSEYCEQCEFQTWDDYTPYLVCRLFNHVLVNEYGNQIRMDSLTYETDCDDQCALRLKQCTEHEIETNN